MPEINKAEYWKKWEQNYKGEGDCAELSDRVAHVKFRDDASYLPWAIADHIFRKQGGTYKFLKFNDDKTEIEIDRCYIKDIIEGDTVSFKEVLSFFIEVEVSWMGETYIEKYPLQDTSGRPIATWTQSDINRNKQRAKTKAIAIISGIGYKLYEDGDLQFETSPETKTDETLKADEEITPKKKYVKKESKLSEKVAELFEEKKEPDNTPKEEQTEDNSENGPVVEEVVKHEENEEKKPVVFTDFSGKTLNRIEAENFVKEQFLTNGTKVTDGIRDYISGKGKGKLAELEDIDLKGLIELIPTIK